MNPLSAEDFERNVVEQLQVLLPAALAGVAAAYLAQDQQDGLAEDDGTSLVKLIAPERTRGAPSGWGDYYPGGIDIETAWPSIEVAVPDQTFEGFSLGQEDADSTISLVIVVWLKHGNFQVLNRMMKRYAAVVFDVLKRPGVLGDASIEEARIAWRTNPENKDEQDRMRSGVLIFLTLATGLLRT